MDNKTLKEKLKTSLTRDFIISNNDSDDDKSETEVVNQDNPIIVNNEEMAVVIPNSQQVSLRDALEVVPLFDGSNVSLSHFIEACIEACIRQRQFYKEVINDTIDTERRLAANSALQRNRNTDYLGTEESTNNKNNKTTWFNVALEDKIICLICRKPSLNKQQNFLYSNQQKYNNFNGQRSSKNNFARNHYNNFPSNNFLRIKNYNFNNNKKHCLQNKNRYLQNNNNTQQNSSYS